jgi:hypothetical protein
MRQGTQQDRRVVEDAVGPAELEERIGKQDGKPDDLDLDRAARARQVERQITENLQ